MKECKRSFAVAVALAVCGLGLAVAPDELAGAQCVTTASCPSTNSHGASLTGMNDVEVDDDGCLEQWDCQYDDGFQTRYIVPT